MRVSSKEGGMIYPNSCLKCGGAVRWQSDIPVYANGVGRSATELKCLCCGWGFERIENVETPGVVAPGDEPKAPKHWMPVGTHGGGPPLGKWNRRYRRPA